MDHLNHYDDCPELRRVDELIENYYQKGDYEACFQGCLELAEQGYALAECQVGYFYLMGQGTPANLDKALYWTKRAAETRTRRKIWRKWNRSGKTDDYDWEYYL